MKQIDISDFYEKYRTDGKGNTAFHPLMMLTLLVYTYCIGERSSRRIEKLCKQDITFRVITTNQIPDHVTISRFRKDNFYGIENLFVKVLKLCKEAKMIKLGIVALDGTKMAGNASLSANRTNEALRREVSRILAEANEIDAKEDALYGKDKRGDELPEDLADPRSRLARLKECKERLDREEKEANVTDPESRIMKTRNGYVQGYNAQAVATEEQIIISAEVTQQENDIQQLTPMLESTSKSLVEAGIADKVEAMACDAGYCSDANIETNGNKETELYIATKKDWKQNKELRKEEVLPDQIPEGLGYKDAMEYKLMTAKGKEIYGKRKIIIEPIFGQIKDCRKIRSFMMRGIKLASAEWKLICATHNLLKLFRSGKLQFA
jgi:transposase